MNRIPSGSGNAAFGRPQAKRVRKTHPIGSALRRIVVLLGSVALAGSIFSIYAGSSGALNAPATTAPFNECPGVGSDSGCQFLIILNPGGGPASIVSNPNIGPFDGDDDTLVGIFNNSGATVSTVGLSATTDIFGFDGDGICGIDSHTHAHYTWVGNGLNGFGFAGCSYGSTGYEGPWVSYSNYSSSNGYKTGNVNFTVPDGNGGFTGLLNGSTTFFSLESKLSAANFTVPTTTTTTSSSTTSTTQATTTTTQATTTTTQATTTTTQATTTTTQATTTTTQATTTTTAPGSTTTLPPPPASTVPSTLPSSSTVPSSTTTTTVPPITSTTIAATPPTSPPATSAPTTAPNVPPATVPSGAPGTGVGGAATSSDNGVLLTASGMSLIAGLAGLALVTRRRRRA
jgi:hypothetical protein